MNFINIFGALPDNPQFDFMFVSQAVPKSIDNTSISKAPALLAAFFVPCASVKLELLK